MRKLIDRNHVKSTSVRRWCDFYRQVKLPKVNLDNQNRIVKQVIIYTVIPQIWRYL